VKVQYETLASYTLRTLPAVYLIVNSLEGDQATIEECLKL